MKSSNHCTGGGGGGGRNNTFTQQLFLSFTDRCQTLILRLRKHIPRIHNAEEKESMPTVRSKVRSEHRNLANKASLKARSHDPFLKIRFLLVPKNGSCEHIKNDLPSNGSIILKKRMEIEHALFSSDTLLER